MPYTERASAIDLSLQSLLQRHSIKETGADIWRQRLRKYTFTAVHTKTHRRRFQIYPLWRAFSNLCVYGERFYRLRVDGRPKCIKRFAFTSVCLYNRLRVEDWDIKIKIGAPFPRTQSMHDKTPDPKSADLHWKEKQRNHLWQLHKLQHISGPKLRPTK